MRTISLIFGLFLSSTTILASDFSSYAFVEDDSTLRIGHQTVRLYGIIIPVFDQGCASTVHPVECGPREAVLALKSKVGSNFVHCDIKEHKPDGSVLATCTANDQDLAAWLIQQGWATAAPNAPPEYAVLEKIARQRGIGMWAIPPGGWPGR
ncbi:MAG TPA: thermonuclease family protein [Candidatus Competibacter sp.]|nr:thermonuclease family protein [Candidatus Competibacter sp.]